MDNTAYGPTPSVGAADFQAITLKEYHTEEYTNSSGSDIPAGGVVVVNGLPMVAVGGIANGKSGTLTYLAAFDVVKTQASAFTANDPVYWDATGDPYTRTAGTGAATDNSAKVLMGFALKNATTSNDRVRVSVIPRVGTSISILNQLANPIADPGAAGAIAVIAGGTCALTGTTGTQTRTLAAPSFVGQEIQLVTTAITSGTLTITVTNLLSAAGVGKSTVAQSTAGMVTILRAVDVGGTLKWSVVSSGGTVA